MKKRICFALIFITLLISGCGTEAKMKDGFYTAEMADYSYGWKEYLCILVKNNTIVYAEFNAKNASGYIKSWDNSYMRNMIGTDGTYPNKYTREYVAQLLEKQNPNNIDAISGATSSGVHFDKLSVAVIEQAFAGDTTIAIVKESE